LPTCPNRLADATVWLVSTPAPAGPNVVRERLPLLAAGVAVFVVLLVATAVTQNNTLGSIVAVYGIVGGVALGLLLAKGERQRDHSDDA
jgi:hypothetical protein